MDYRELQLAGNNIEEAEVGVGEWVSGGKREKVQMAEEIWFLKILFCQQKEKQALKKLDNVRKDHENRLEALQQAQVPCLAFFQILFKKWEP